MQLWLVRSTEATEAKHLSLTVTGTAAEVCALQSRRWVIAHKTSLQYCPQASGCAFAQAPHNIRQVLDIPTQILRIGVKMNQWLPAPESWRGCIAVCESFHQLHSPCLPYPLPNNCDEPWCPLTKFATALKQNYYLDLDDRMLHIWRPYKDDLLHIRNVYAKEHPDWALKIKGKLSECFSGSLFIFQSTCW